MTIPVNYKVYLKPLLAANGTYGSEIDITSLVSLNSIAPISRQLEGSDYDTGVFIFDSITITCFNSHGRFNTSDDSRSLFKSIRDRAKVRIIFQNADETLKVMFKGIIDDQATRTNEESDTVEIVVLSEDTVIKQTTISSGTITNIMTIKQAITAILSDPMITAVLTVSSLNINPELNFTIDDGSYFNFKTGYDALVELIQASNSYFFVENSTCYVVPKSEFTNSFVGGGSYSLFELNGPYALNGFVNVLRIFNYTSGKSRQFNSIRWKDSTTLVSNETTYADVYGYRQKIIGFDWITDTTKKQSVLDSYSDLFKAQKAEVDVTLPYLVGKDIDILDFVQLDAPLKLTPANTEGVLLTADLWGLGDGGQICPHEQGSLSISPDIVWRVIGKQENTSDFTMTIRLRQKGKTSNDEV